jgi:3'-phosphoadenosine 5'-phosphosulfate sulfotransferase (PAPS reductase)/FAD synthetase
VSAKDRIGDRIVVASVSGGKDSAAMCLWLQEQGIEHVRVFADTGWEAQETYDYLRGPLTEKLGPIEEVGYPGGMAALVEKKGMFPSRVRRFCTENLKVKPIAAFCDKLRDESGRDVVQTVGIRAGESLARSKLTEWEWSDAFDCDVWRPLISWSEQDVIDIHTRHGLVPNPLYLRGASRVGCWPCIFARKKEIEFIADQDPRRIHMVRSLEEKLSSAARMRYAESGDARDPERTFFSTHARECVPIPIDEVVRWARTGRGGRQYELFAPETEPGCVRWGLCETTTEEQ